MKEGLEWIKRGIENVKAADAEKPFATIDHDVTEIGRGLAQSLTPDGTARGLSTNVSAAELGSLTPNVSGKKEDTSTVGRNIFDETLNNDEHRPKQSR